MRARPNAGWKAGHQQLSPTFGLETLFFFPPPKRVKQIAAVCHPPKNKSPPESLNPFGKKKKRDGAMDKDALLDYEYPDLEPLPTTVQAE